MPREFLGSKLKIERADHHIRDLDSQIKIFLDAHPCFATVEHDVAKDIFLARHIVPPQPVVPKHWLGILGDAIHNLRTSLDHLACELVRQSGRDITGVYFPFSKDETTFESAVRNRHIDRAGPDVVDIMRSLKPFHGGNQHLRDLHDLDIQDKHTGLVPVYAILPNTIATEDSRGISFTAATSVSLNVSKDYYKPGDTIAMPMGILFGPGPFKDKPISETLSVLTQLVIGIIQKFEFLP